MIIFVNILCFLINNLSFNNIELYKNVEEWYSGYNNICGLGVIYMWIWWC